MNVFWAPSGDLPKEASSPEEIARFVVEAAVHAPSIHNTQPWWFSHSGSEISVHADVERRLAVADPNGREMMISCGAALFTARVALRYLGLVPAVRLLPDPDLPNLVARIGWRDHTPPVDYERQLFTEIPRRRTHRGGFEDEPLPASLLSALREEAAREHATLRILGDDGQRATLAALVEAADHALRLDTARVKEEARWTPPPGSQRRDGVPATAYPARPERTEPSFPSRDFAHGHGWGLPPSGEGAMPRSAGLVTVLSTAADRPEDWVNAGQALQRVLLLASASGVSAALHSQPLELVQLRDFIAEHLCGGAQPQMITRFGTTGQSSVSVRRRVDEVLL
ncbi:MAG: Acg family FMN-binding oxidoreductase [Streptosporangiaceae bacterium]